MSAPRTTGEDVDTSKTYVFTSGLTGEDLVFAVDRLPADRSDASNATVTLKMANRTRVSTDGQWFLTKVNGNQPGIFYRVHPASLGVGQSLDVVNEGGAVNSSRLMMAPSGDSSGQAWAFDRWSDNEADGYRLSNKLTGPDVHLDVTGGDFEPHLFGGDFPGQHWTLGVPAAPQPPGPTTILSTGAIVGLAMVAALGLGLLVFGMVRWLCWPRGRPRTGKTLEGELEGRPVEVAEKTASIQSFRSTQSRTLHPLETTVGMHSRHDDIVSPEEGSLYPRGTSFFVTRSNTGTTGRTVVAVEPWPGMVAELPDKRYTFTSARS